jgi:hypothetical protein
VRLDHEEARVDLSLLRTEERAKSTILTSLRADRSMTQMRASTILEYWRGIHHMADELEYKSSVDDLVRHLERDIDGLKELQQSLTMRMEMEGATEQLAMTQQLLSFLSRILDKLKKRRRELAEEASLNFLLLNSAFLSNKLSEDKDKKPKESQREGREPKAKEPQAQARAKGMSK